MFQNLFHRHKFLPEYIVFFFAFFTRFFRLSTPVNYMFDEVYYAFTAREMLHGNKAAWEWWNTPPEGVAYEWTHPYFAKELIALGMKIFGENSFGWRFFPALFGTGTIVLIYFVTKKLFNNRLVALLAAAIASLDGLLLVMSRIAMTDTCFIFLSLLALLCFLYKRYIFMSIFMGLAFASKWTGMYGIGVFGLLYTAQLFMSVRKSHPKTFKSVRLYMLFALPYTTVLFLYFTKLQTHIEKLASASLKNFLEIPFQAYQASYAKYPVISFLLLVTIIFGPTIAGTIILFRKKFIGVVAYFVVIPIIVYLLSYIPFFLSGPHVNPSSVKPATRNTLFEKLTIPKSAGATSWETLIGLQEQMWWYHTGLNATHAYQSRPWQWVLDARPVWFYVDYKDTSIANVYNLGNPIVLWFGVVSILFLIWEFIRTRSFAAAVVVACYLAYFLPWQLSPRIMFFYHYTPAIPFLAIASAYMLYKLLPDRTGKAFVGGYFVLAIAAFLWLFPLWTAIHVPKSFADTYFLMKSWK